MNDILSVADFLSDQRNEPWPGGTDAARLHYWRDKAITASKRLRIASRKRHVDDGGDAMRKLFPDPLNPDLNEAQSAAWEEGGRVHNWQNHIGPRIKALWGSLSDDFKTALANDAQDTADNEEWE